MKKVEIKIKKITINCKWYLYLYISSVYDFIIFILNKNIYIIIYNISLSGKESYLKNVLDILYIKNSKIIFKNLIF